MEAKQVIVMKKFPKSSGGLRTGKYVAQGAHASLGAVLSIAKHEEKGLSIPLDDPYINAWLIGRFKKVTVYVETDEELVRIYTEARAAGLPASLIKDAGLTEFDGVATLTAVGVGPGNPETIDKITGGLPLF